MFKLWRWWKDGQSSEMNGKKTFITVFKLRGTCKGLDVLELSSLIDFDNQCFKDHVSDSVRWHKNCYSSYCSQRNISSSVSTDVMYTDVKVASSSNRSSRSKRNVNIDWKKVCEQTKIRGETELRKVEYETFWTTLERKCKEKGDTDMLLKVGNDFSALPALEARYHNKCHVYVYKI